MKSFRVVQRGDVVAGRYLVEDTLGAGRRTVVFKALDQASTSRVALKVLRPGLSDIPEVAARFTREARISRQLEGPHIVSAIDMGADDGVMYYTSELLDGQRLDQRMSAAGGPFSVADAVEIMHQLLEALTETHGQGVIHRDLRPTKVFLTRTEHSQNYVRLMDFGMAQRTIIDPLEAQISLVDTPLGSMPYLAPEQIVGGKVTERTDIYAAGHILFEILAGHRVYPGIDYGEIARLKVRGTDPSLSGSPLRGSLGPAIRRATALDPEGRYPSCQEFITHLHELRRMATSNSTTDEHPIVRRRD